MTFDWGPAPNRDGGNMSFSARFAVYALLLCGVAGCSSSPAQVDGGPPVPDPGGPFNASIASNRRIDGLNLVLRFHEKEGSR